MRITSPKLHTSHLTANEEALMRCQTALELKDKGEYQNAREVMHPLWGRVGDRPEIKGLHPSVSAEVLLCVGILTGWIGSKEGIEEAQEIAKNLISESISYHESAGDIKKIAASRAELAYCYWREGALDEARIIFNESLQKLTAQGNTRARALLRLAIVEWSDSRFQEALRILTENSYLFNKITNHSIKGAYHSQLAMVLRKVAPSEQSVDDLKQVLAEYEKADHQFKLAQNIIFRADVKNNLGFLLYKLSRFKQAHEYLEQARRLRSGVKDKVGIAQIDDTRAQVLIAQGKFKEAETIARSAARVLEKSGQQCLLTDALITHGIALARLKQTERAQFTFQKAIEVAHQVGALNKAGLAALTLIEELDDLSPGTLFAAYDRASDWLAKSQSQDLLLRLNAAARKVFLALSGEVNAEEATEDLINKSYDLHTEVLKFEGSLIQKALAQANGSVTRAASLLEMSYQGLAYVIESRHKDLLKQRSPVRRRTPRAQRSDSK
ncbi:MAG: tetratricopeptide repeat protein [Acidobacteriota bacterium]|nr:tetratricopeptide repeat protein [Acidobacteriota bacterium]